MDLRALAVLVLLAAACARKDSVEYVQMNPVKDLIEVSFEAPKSWGRHVSAVGDADSAWAIELVHPENRLINIDIKKYATSGKKKGFPVMTSAELLERIQGLPKTKVGPVEPAQTKNIDKASRFAFEGDYLQVSGGEAPRMKGVDVFFERDGFLYVVDYAVPVEEFDKHHAIFQRVLDTLKLEPV